MKTFGKVCLSIFLFILSMVYSSIIVEILVSLGIDVLSLNNSLKLGILTIIDISFILIMYLIYHRTINHNIKDYFKNFKEFFKVGLKCWLIGISLMILFNFIIMMLYQSEAQNEQIVQSTLNSYPLYMVFSTVLYAPFIEELVFRKSLRDIFKDKYSIIYIICSGLLFGFIHTVAGLSNPMELLYILPYGIVGSMFAYAYTKTDNIFVPITFHLIHNALLVSISLIGG